MGEQGLIALFSLMIMSMVLVLGRKLQRWDKQKKKMLGISVMTSMILFLFVQLVVG
ncbi:hypothetical protein ALCH109712_07935 [Alkalicoccus chagannorensis]